VVDKRFKYTNKEKSSKTQPVKKYETYKFKIKLYLFIAQSQRYLKYEQKLNLGPAIHKRQPHFSQFFYLNPSVTFYYTFYYSLEKGHP